MAQLNVFCNERGGIKDDFIVTELGNHFHVVSNAACAEKILNHFNKHKSKFDVELKPLDNALIALQGRQSKQIIQTNLKFMEARHMQVAGVDCLVTRCGYTGEDGYEISIPKNAETVMQYLSKEAVLGGLGSRDSLRIEAGLNLYGNEMNEDTSPLECGMGWTIDKERDNYLGSGQFTQRFKKIGLIVDGPPVRHSPLFDLNRNQVGNITSGVFSPILKKSVALAQTNSDEKEFYVEGRKEQRARRVKLPFVQTQK